MEREAGSFMVYVGGALIGQYDGDELGERNVLLVGLSEDPRMHLGNLADAFGITTEALRLIRRQYEAEGLAAVVGRRRGGSHPKLTPTQMRRLETLFASGLSASEAYAKMPRLPVGLVRVRQLHRVWKTRRLEETMPRPEETESSGSATPSLPGLESDVAGVVETSEVPSADPAGSIFLVAGDDVGAVEVLNADAIAEGQPMGGTSHAPVPSELSEVNQVAAALSGAAFARSAAGGGRSTRTAGGDASYPFGEPRRDLSRRSCYL